MVTSLPVILLLGSLLGFLSGIGVGGGSLLMLWLTLVQQMPQEQARGINLLFFIPAALAACCFRWKQGALDLKAVLPAIAAGCLAAAAFSCLGQQLDPAWLKRGFGILLLLTGVRELRCSGK